MDRIGEWSAHGLGRPLSRRRFVALGGAAGMVAAVGLVLPRRLGHAAAGTDLVEPAIVASRDGVLTTTLEARFGPAQAAGRAVTSRVYQGSFPGPTLAVRPGDMMMVSLVNGLDETTNLHLHGFHVAPSGTADNVLAQVDASQTDVRHYAIPTNHPAGFYFYHPHMYGTSDVQVNGGMAGALIVRGDLDELPGIAGVPERILVLQATEFDADGVQKPIKEQSRKTQLHLINGQLAPTIRGRPGETQRWRIVNATAETFYNLALDGHRLHQIAKDGNTLNAVWTRDAILLTPGERVEVLVQFGAAGSYAFRMLTWGEGMQTQSEAVLTTVVAAGDVVAPAPLPTTLLPFEDLAAVPVDRKREIVFQTLPGEDVRIDGKKFDPNRVDQTVTLGATEEWTIRNDSTDWHPFHIHVNPYQVVAINGEPSVAKSYEDTTPVPAGGSITMRTRFLDFTGKFVYHCHILGHEDNGMMGVVEVVP